MTKHDFFNTIIKLFGLYTIVKLIFAFIPSTFVFALQNTTFMIVLYSIALLCFIVVLNILLIFKSELIIKWLKLDQSFDDEHLAISNFNSEKLLTLGLIIIGGLLIINNLSSALSLLSSSIVTKTIYFKESTNPSSITNPKEWINLTLAILNIITGYFWVVYSNKISQYIVRINHLNEKKTNI